MTKGYIRKSKKKKGGCVKISAMKLFSNIYTVTQAALNLESVHKTGYAYDSDRTSLGRKKVTKNQEAHYFDNQSIPNLIHSAMYP